MFVELKSSFQRAILCVYHVKISFFLPVKARPKYIACIFTEFGHFLFCTPIANHTLLGQNSRFLISTSVLIHLNISILT